MSLDATTLYEEKSFWLRQYGPYRPRPALEGDRTVDVAVVGGGFTGLSAARELRRDDPGLSVAVLEGDCVGYGASGRNAGFSMKLFGLEPELTRARWGDARTREAQRVMYDAVAFVKDLVEKHGLESDYQHTGMFRVAYTDRQLRRLEKTHALLEELGVAQDMGFATRADLQAQFHTDRFLGGLWEREVGILDPCKHVRALARLAEEAGAGIYERTPVCRARRRPGGVVLETDAGHVRADKVVFATNAYSRSIEGLPKLRTRQIPVWTYVVVTERLSDAQWEAVGWEGRQSFEDNRQLVHYFRPTADGRLLMGGGAVRSPWGEGFDHDFAPKLWRHCEAHLKWLFPQLRDVPIAYRWGGPVSCPLDMTPE
ncbi:MAG: FAD-dependent oxidoreductase, partial [Myxococcota bacterium]|nr:FAD-dependent oxidoreductase [Myxococcota bacterium]